MKIVDQVKSKFNVVKTTCAAGVAVGASLLPALARAQAAAIDTSDAVTAIEAAAVAVGVVGAAAFGVVIAVKVWKWMRGAA